MNAHPFHRQSVPDQPSALARVLGVFANSCSLAAQFGLLAQPTYLHEQRDGRHVSGRVANPEGRRR